jgi:hypothetical protein
VSNIDAAVARGRIKAAAFMKDDAVISKPGKPGVDSYGNQVPSTPTTTTVKCSIFSALDGVLSESVLGQKLKGRRGWRVIFPHGTDIDRTYSLTVTTQAGGTFKLEILETRGKQTRALVAEAACAELVPAPTFP